MSRYSLDMPTYIRRNFACNLRFIDLVNSFIARVRSCEIFWR